VFAVGLVAPGGLKFFFMLFMFIVCFQALSIIELDGMTFYVGGINGTTYSV